MSARHWPPVGRPHPRAVDPGDFALPHPGPRRTERRARSSSTTSGSRSSAASAPTSPRRTSTGSPANGLRYNRFHVTAMCSPTRACLLTGRNHHAVGMGFLADMPTAYPGLHGAHPEVGGDAAARCCATRATTRSRWGSGTSCPRASARTRGPFDRWPLGYGFERYYGFLQGDTNQWTPNLVRDNHYVDPPRTRRGRLSPHRGPRRRRDPARARTSSRRRPTSRSSSTSRLGAMHAPHHVAPEWVEPYRGRFDGGWERLARARRSRGSSRRASCPKAPCSPSGRRGCRTGTSSRADERRMLRALRRRCSRASSRTPTRRSARCSTFLDDIGVLDNTLVMLMSDNGASAEGGTPARSTSTGSRCSSPRRVDEQPRAPRRVGRLPLLQPLLVGLGVGRATHRSACGSATRGSAARARR